MKIEKIDHICFAVKDLEETKRAYKEDFGLIPKYEYIAESDERVKFISNFGGSITVPASTASNTSIWPTNSSGAVAADVGSNGFSALPKMRMFYGGTGGNSGTSVVAGGNGGAGYYGCGGGGGGGGGAGRSLGGRGGDGLIIAMSW